MCRDLCQVPARGQNKTTKKKSVRSSPCFQGTLNQRGARPSATPLFNRSVLEVTYAEPALFPHYSICGPPEHEHCLGTCKKCRLQGTSPDLLSLNVHFFTRPPGDLCAHPSVRSMAHLSLSLCLELVTICTIPLGLSTDNCVC